MRSRYLAAMLATAAIATQVSCTSDGGPAEVKSTGSVLVGAYVDRNANGAIDNGVDGNASGVRVTLTPASGGATVASGTTAATGLVLLSDIPVGGYQVAIDSTSIGDTLQMALQSTLITVSANLTDTVLIPLTYPRRTVAQARQLTPGKRVLVQAVALTGAGTFPDTTGQIADSTGTVRLVRILTAGFHTGDSVRVVGTPAARDGQPVLADAIVFSVKSGDRPVPRAVTLAQAASALGGTLDAALVRITGATILNAQSSGGDIVLTVTDSTGALQVFIDRTIGSISDPLAAGAILDATGVLVPIPAGSGWRLRPRTASDLAAHYPTVTTAQARLLDNGRVVSIIGVALNGSASFTGSIVHVSDSSGALRTLAVSPTVFTADSVRLLGTVVVDNGQKVLTNVTATVLGTGHPPAPVDLSSAGAATAAAGTKDAALVRVPGAKILADTVGSDAGHVLTVDDGSGKLRVVMDPRTGAWTPADTVDSIVDITGVLVPDATGTRWVLKPRSAADLVKR